MRRWPIRVHSSHQPGPLAQRACRNRFRSRKELRASWDRLRTQQSGFKRPGLESGDLENLWRSKTFLVNDPPAEQSRGVLSNLFGQPECNIMADMNWVLRLQLILQSKVEVRYPNEIIGRRNTVRTNKHSCRHALVHRDE